MTQDSITKGDKKRYVLYGTGYEGEKFIYSNYEIKNHIAYCIDAVHTGFFHGISIVTLENAKDVEKYYIYVAAVWETYEKIKNILEKIGLQEYINFRWASEYNRKIVIINANCHGTPIAQILMKSNEFRKKYIIHNISPIYENDEIDISLLENVDVYIHQNIRKDNSSSYKNSDEYIFPKLKKKCVKIAIPNFYDSMGCWVYPQHIGGLLPSLELKVGCLNTFYKDAVLELAYGKKFTRLSQYIEFYKNYMIENDILQEGFDRDIQKLQSREEQWDIKISDYILENFKKIPLFVDRGHPSRYLMLEVGKRIAKYIGLDDVEDIEDVSELAQLGLPTPILPCVKKYFQFEYEITEPMNKRVFSLGDVLEDELSNYIREYLWWSHEVMVN